MRATENVTITNCQVSGYDEGHAARRHVQADGATYNRGPTGRIKFGTESNGGFKNITISNCVFDYCRGLRSKASTAERSKTSRSPTSRCATSSTRRSSSAWAIARADPNNPPPGVIKRVRISNVVASNVDARHGVLISGIPGHPIEDLSLSDMRIAYQGGGSAADAALEPPEKETEYPEPDMFGNMPAFGLYARHVTGLTTRDIHFSLDKPDARPALRLDEVSGADIDHLVVPPRGAGPLFVLRSVRDFLLRNSPGIADMKRASVDKESF